MTVHRRSAATVLALLAPGTLLVVRAAVSWMHVFPGTPFPSRWDAIGGLGQELRSGRLITDAIASLFRVSGFIPAVAPSSHLH